MTIMTPRQYVLHSVAEYPSLYAQPTYNECALKAFDQLFNTIGNGARNHDELIEMLSPPIPENLEELAGKYITHEPIYYGYEHVEELFDGYLVPDRSVHQETFIAIESERDQYPKIKLWHECPRYPFNPYPNFEPRYSTVYKTDLLSLSQEWWDAVVWFYQHCEAYFNSDQVKGYHYYFGGDVNDPEDQQKIEDYKESIERKFANGEYTCNADVTKAYGIEFDGDYVAFIKRRWEKELARINEFIKETIELAQR